MNVRDNAAVQQTPAATADDRVPAVAQRDLELLLQAADDAGLRGLPHVQAVDHSRGELARSRMRFGLSDIAAARALIAAAIDELGLR